MQCILLTTMVLLAALGGCGGKHEAEIEWMHDLDSALAEARRSNRPVMIDFMAEWCPPCRAMEDSTFNRPDVIRKAASFVPLRIDVDKQREVAVRYSGNARKYGGIGIPNILFMTAGETRLRHIIGYQNPEQLITIMDSVLVRFESISHLEVGLESIHKTGDTICRINPDIMADIARLAFITAYGWADR